MFELGLFSYLPFQCLHSHLLYSLLLIIATYKIKSILVRFHLQIVYKTSMAMLEEEEAASWFTELNRLRRELRFS